MGRWQNSIAEDTTALSYKGQRNKVGTKLETPSLLFPIVCNASECCAGLWGENSMVLACY